MIATHVSSGRGQDEIIAQFKKISENAKQRPKAIFVDGSTTYDGGFNKMFYSRYKDKKVELVKKVGIQARETNNIIERMHGTLKVQKSTLAKTSGELQTITITNVKQEVRN